MAIQDIQDIQDPAATTDSILAKLEQLGKVIATPTKP
jgi:hypothetical protein